MAVPRIRRGQRKTEVEVTAAWVEEKIQAAVAQVSKVASYALVQTTIHDRKFSLFMLATHTLRGQIESNEHDTDDLLVEYYQQAYKINAFTMDENTDNEYTLDDIDFAFARLAQHLGLGYYNDEPWDTANRQMRAEVAEKYREYVGQVLADSMLEIEERFEEEIVEETSEEMRRAQQAVDEVIDRFGLARPQQRMILDDEEEMWDDAEVIANVVEEDDLDNYRPRRRRADNRGSTNRRRR